MVNFLSNLSLRPSARVGCLAPWETNIGMKGLGSLINEFFLGLDGCCQK